MRHLKFSAVLGTCTWESQVITHVDYLIFPYMTKSDVSATSLVNNSIMSLPARMSVGV